MKRFTASATVVLALAAVGCSHLGPTTITRDRFDYNTAISDSWKEQTLLNIVKLRYADMPVFVEVVSIVSGYQIEGQIDASGTVFSSSGLPGDFVSVGAGSKYIDRPTITYAPITGTQFNKSFMTPIPPAAILFLIQSGWPVSLVFPMTVDSVNGLRSRIDAGTQTRRGNTEYYRVVELLDNIQKSGAVGMQIRRSESDDEATVMFIQRDNLSDELKDSLRELNELLGIPPDTQTFDVAYGLIPQEDTELVMSTRSMLQIMIALATQVQVAPGDVAEGVTVPSLADLEEDVAPRQRTVRVHYSKDKPTHAAVTVKYRQGWYWIDDRDFKSKRTFAFLMILFSLTETGGREGLPIVTIPAN